MSDRRVVVDDVVVVSCCRTRLQVTRVHTQRSGRSSRVSQSGNNEVLLSAGQLPDHRPVTRGHCRKLLTVCMRVSRAGSVCTVCLSVCLSVCLCVCVYVCVCVDCSTCWTRHFCLIISVKWIVRRGCLVPTMVPRTSQVRSHRSSTVFVGYSADRQTVYCTGCCLSVSLVMRPSQLDASHLSLCSVSCQLHCVYKKEASGFFTIILANLKLLL